MSGHDTMLKTDAVQLAKNEVLSAFSLVLAALNDMQMLEAIKTYRSHTGCGLKDSKDMIERLIEIGHAYYLHREAIRAQYEKRDRFLVTYERIHEYGDKSYHVSSFDSQSDAVAYAASKGSDDEVRDIRVSKVTYVAKRTTEMVAV